MGAYIDKIVFTTLLAGALYLFFMGAFSSIPLAASAAFIALALLKQLSGSLPLARFYQKRRSRSAAAAIIDEMAFMHDSEARETAKIALENEYPNEMNDAEFIMINKHPTGRGICADDVLPIYKNNIGREKLIIATPARADEAAHALTSSMTKPRVRLIDGPMLTEIIAKKGGRAWAEAPKKRRSSRWKTLIKAAGRAHAGRCIFSGGALMLVYFFTGRTMYLLTALTLFMVAAIGVKGRPRPNVLFD